MATFKTQKVVGDTGSQEHARLVKSYNALLNALGDLVTGLKTAADINAVHTLATTAETALQTNVYKQQEKPNVPLFPVSPAA